MKTAVYLDEGNTQLVLSPENEWEKNILKMINKDMPDKTFWGEFYACQGGWIRENDSSAGGNSLIMRIGKP